MESQGHPAARAAKMHLILLHCVEVRHQLQVLFRRVQHRWVAVRLLVATAIAFQGAAAYLLAFVHPLLSSFPTQH